MGKGHFAQVYECWDEWGNLLVAKILVPRNMTYKEVRKQWTDELRNLLNFRHPKITYIYDAFEYQNTFYLIIERCPCTLADLIKNPRFNVRKFFLAIARDLLQAIDFIHGHGYVHKDIHEGNLFVSWVRYKSPSEKNPVLTFKVGDLGITRLETDINIFNTMLAKWMLPPEFLNPNEFGFIDHRVDIYHAGLLLLSILLGDSPYFTNDDIIQGKPRQKAEEIRNRYGPAIAKALRRHVENRIYSALDFWKEIKKLKSKK